jgi:hypothetical protein
LIFSCSAFLLQKTGLTNFAQPTTLLAPTNDAFARLPKGVVDFLTSGTDAANAALKTVLTYHVFNAGYPTNILADRKQLVTAQGESVEVYAQLGDQQQPFFNYAEVVLADQFCSFGANVLHQIDNVLLPAALATVVQTIGQSVMTSPALMRPQLIGSAQQGTIVDFVVNTPSLILLSTVMS